MSNNLDLKLRLTATDQNVAGTVRNTKKEVQGLAGTLGSANKASKGTASSMAGLTTAGGEANRMFRLQKGALQQAGYQFQDLAVQIGGGTSAFVAIGQQGSQLLSVLGPGGALLGAVLAIGSVVGGTLVRSFGDGEKAVDALEAAMGRLNETAEDSDGMISLTRQIRDLAAESEIAARARIASAMQDAVDASEAAARGIAGAFGDLPIVSWFDPVTKDIDQLTRSIGTFEAYMQTGYAQGQLKELGEMFGFSGDRAEEAGTQIGQLLTNLRATPSLENFRALEDAMASFMQEGGKPSAELSKLIGDLGVYFDSARDAAELTEYLQGALENLSGATGAAVKERQDLISGLEDEYLALSLTDKQLLEHRLNVVEATDDERARALGLHATIKALEDKAEADEKAARKAAEAAAAEERARDALERRAQALLDQADPLAKFARDWQVVQEALAADFIDEGQARLIMDSLVNAGQVAGEQAAEKFINPFEQSAGRVSQAVQQAIASGDWSSIGDAVGNALAASMSAIVGDQITKSLSKELTDQSSVLAQAGAAFAGPLAGAVVGGAIQLAMAELGDYFSDDWDPTVARQAAQGTGTVLGSIEEKSKSIAKAVDISAEATSELVGINRAMLRALENVQLGIQGASGMIARGSAGAEIYGPGVRVNAFDVSGITGGEPVSQFVVENAASAFLNMFTLGLGGEIGKALGGRSRQVDEGIQIIGGHISDLIDGTLVRAFSTYRARKHALDDYDTYERYANLSDSVGQQFALVFESIYDSVGAGLDVFGMDIGARAAGFRVGTQKLSLEGMNASQQQEALEAYFGTVFDRLAGYTVPWLDEFQRAGEGLGETLARVATQTQVTQRAVDSLGIRFDDLAGRELVEASQRLVELGGGLDQFIGSMQNFIGNFASESQQFVLAQSNLTKTLGEAGLVLPDTRQGFYDLMQAQNGSTEQGAENIATLLRLQGVADQYYSSLEEQAGSLARTQRDSLKEAMAVSDTVARALKGLQIDTPARTALRRETALETLQQMTANGNVQPGDRLNTALEAATQINATDFATFGEYIEEVSRAGAVLTGLQKVTDRQVTKEQRALEAIESEMKKLRQESSAQGRAVAHNTAKTARLLDRIEAEGRFVS